MTRWTPVADSPLGGLPHPAHAGQLSRQRHDNSDGRLVGPPVSARCLLFRRWFEQLALACEERGVAGRGAVGE